MGAPDCGTCAFLGYRSCDECGGPAWAGRISDGQLPNLYRVGDRELCGNCCDHDEAAVWK